MPESKFSYDEECEVLARHFLGKCLDDTLAKRLAQHIQEQVEAWLTTEEALIENSERFLDAMSR